MRTTIFSRMNKLPLMLCLAALFVCLAANAAFARSGAYVTPKLGVNILKAKDGGFNDTTYSGTSADGTAIGFGVAGGYDFSAKNNLNLRLEGDVMFRTGISNDDSTLEYNVHTVMISAFYDFRNSSMFTPYVGAGLGLSIVNLAFDEYAFQYGGRTYLADVSGTGASLAAQLGAGCHLALSERMGFDFGYRYLYLGSTSIDFDLENHGTESWEADLSGHEFTIGFRFNF